MNKTILLKIFITIAILLLFRFGLHIPAPYVDIDYFAKSFQSGIDSKIKLLSFVSSSLLGTFSLFSLGVMPYILASVIVQVVSFILDEEKKQGQENKLAEDARFSQKMTRILTLVFAFVQTGILFFNFDFGRIFYHDMNFLGFPLCFGSIATGSMITLWIGEFITEYGIGNGVSMLIFSNIAIDIITFITKTIASDVSRFSVFIFFLFLIVVIFFIIFVERSIRPVLVQYSSGRYNQISSKKSSFLPMKINFSGVMPLIFASTVIGFLFNILDSLINKYQLTFLINKTGNTIAYYVLCFIFLTSFSFIYNGIVFNVKKVSDSLKRSGSFLPGIRPGKSTEAYFLRILNSLTLIGSIYLFTIVSLMDLARWTLSIGQMINGSSFIIMVIIALELINKFQVELLSNYKHLMKSYLN